MVNQFIAVMRNVLLLTVFTLLITSTSCNYFRERGWFGGSEDTLEVWQARQDSIRIADSLRQAVILERERVRQQEIADSLQRVEQERLEYEARFRYHIIVGSFVTPEYATSFREHVEGLGYNATKMDLPGTRFEMISAEVHESLRNAFERLPHFQEEIAVDAWIWAR